MNCLRLGSVFGENGLSPRILFVRGFTGSSRLRMLLLITIAVTLAAAAACAQEIPYSNTNNGSGLDNGNLTNQLGQGNQVNCSDPLMAASSQCGGSREVSGGFPGGTFQVPSYQQGQSLIYTDDQGRLTNRDRTMTIPLPPEPLTEFQKFTSSTTGMVLPIFGANLFRSVPSTFAPLDNAPVPADYVIGPDDLVRLRVWGQTSVNANLRVDRTGNIFVPQVGTVQVAGKRFGDLDQTLRAALGKIYRNFDLSVQLGQIRAIQIYVTGEARRPGVYTVSSLSTLVDALFTCGGPSVQGSMRHIELRRGGAATATFDLYRFLISGDKSKDTKLEAGDVIFIPSVGPEVAVLGSVRRPAIYELLPGDTVADVLKYASNLSALASDARASLERNAEHSGREAMEVRLDAAGMATPMADGDILHVISIVSKYQKTVTLRGNTANPGRFAWHEGMRLSDLIPDKESLLTRDYWWKRASLGFPSPEFQPLPALTALRQPTNPIDLPLQQMLMARQEANTTNTTQTANAAQGQNQPQNQPQNQSQARPPDNTAAYFWDNSQGAYVTDSAPPPNNQQLANTANANATAANQQGGATLSAQQRQTGPRGSESALAETDNETPEQINPQATRRTVVRLTAPDIDWSYAVIERMDPDTLKTTLVSFDLGKLVLQHDASQDLELKPGDVVSVFSQSDIHVPIAEQTGFIRLEGEFVHSGTYSVRPGETLRSLVERAGGFTSNAYLYGSVFTRESTRVIQQRRMDETVQRMILQMQRGTLAMATSATGDLSGLSAAQGSIQGLISQLQQVRATGRVVFAFKPDSKGTEVVPDISLENGDTFLVPSVPSTVNAVGAIFNQNSFLYRPEVRLESYLQLAGGPNSDADKKHMFVVRANGAVVSKEAMNGTWGNEFYKLKLNPGDTIIVPDKSLKPSALRAFMTWSQFLSQITFSAAAATAVF
jgi:protein involved in polysaccharide export with SLBB domain